YIDGLNIEFSGKDNNNNFIIINCSSKKELEKVRFVNFKLLLKGANNKIEINAPIFFTSNKWEILGNSFISIKSSKYSIGGVYISCKNSSLEIDEDFSSTNRCTIGLAGTKGTNIKIGRDCMFASDISLLSTDFHKIYDNTTGKVLNIPEMGIKIGNHVWVGSGVRILKDTEVGNNIVIGTGTVLTKTFHDDNVIIAGNPGKIVKRNVNWGRELPDDTFENYQKNVAILRNK
ncbi:MAG: acyltransferase, partial [Candidatus Gastranaerophilaceae bacterium]